MKALNALHNVFGKDLMPDALSNATELQAHIIVKGKTSEGVAKINFPKTAVCQPLLSVISNCQRFLYIF